MLVLVLLMSFLTVFVIIMALSKSINTERIIIAGRLDKLGKSRQVDAHDELNLPLFTRVVKPMLDSINRGISNMMPSEIKSKIEKRLIQAGNPMGFSVSRWINFQIGLIVGLPALTLAVAIPGGAPLKRIVVVILLEVALGFVAPRFMLSKKISERQGQIENSLPDVLDLLTVSVEAGLGFDAALARVVDKVPGQLSEEFTKVIQEIKVGTPRREALRNMANRVAVADLSTFIGSIIQADQLGVSIGNVLRIQSQQMRQKRRQRAQEKAMKAPVKMLFPMVFFIFPTIFAVLLGPIVIRLMDTFMK